MGFALAIVNVYLTKTKGEITELIFRYLTEKK